MQIKALNPHCRTLRCYQGSQAAVRSATARIQSCAFEVEPASMNNKCQRVSPSRWRRTAPRAGLGTSWPPSTWLPSSASCRSACNGPILAVVLARLPRNRVWAISRSLPPRSMQIKALSPDCCALRFYKGSQAAVRSAIFRIQSCAFEVEPASMNNKCQRVSPSRRRRTAPRAGLGTRWPPSTWLPSCASRRSACNGPILAVVPARLPQNRIGISPDPDRPGRCRSRHALNPGCRALRCHQGSQAAVCSATARIQSCAFEL